MKQKIVKIAAGTLLCLSMAACSKEKPAENTTENVGKIEEQTKNNEQNKENTTNNNKGESVPAEEAGMETESKKFKPADFGLKVKDKYVYEYLGLKFELPETIKTAMNNKEIFMLDDQSPIMSEENKVVKENLTYAMLTFGRLTEEQRDAEVDRMGDGYNNWLSGIERLGTIAMIKKGVPEDEVKQITGCKELTLLGESKDGDYDYYLTSNNDKDDELLKAFKETKVEVIERKDIPENGWVLSEKTDLENTETLPEVAGEGSLSGLVTKDIDGNEFTGAEFAKHDLTMVNVFATWCTACIKEIPDLVKVQEEMKDKGVNIVGVVTDTFDDNGENAEAIKLSKEIAEKTKVNYKFIMPDKTNFNGRLTGIQALPTTFFVDKEGNVVGETYPGAKSADEWKATIEKELENVRR